MVDHVGEGAVQAGRWPAEPAPILFLLSGALLGLATLATVASCWIAAPTLLNLGLSIGAYVTASGLAAWANHRQKLIASDLLLALASLSFAASIWQMGQVFDVAEDRSGFVTALLAVVVVISFTGFSITTIILWMFLLLIAIILNKIDRVFGQPSFFVAIGGLYLIRHIMKLMNNKMNKNNYIIKIDFEYLRKIIINNLIFIFLILYVTFEFDVFSFEGGDPSFDYFSYLMSLIFLTITFYSGLARFSGRALKEPDRVSAIGFGWFSFISLAWLIPIAVQPLDTKAMLTLVAVWLAEASILFYVSFKSQHLIGVWIAIGAVVSLFCAGLAVIGLAWSGVVVGLLVASLLALGSGLVVKGRVEAVAVPL